MTVASRNLVSAEEYADRLRGLRGLLAEAGLDAAIVWGRGGGSVDRFSNIRYLTGFYPVFPTIRDLPGAWSDRGLAALLVTQDEAILFTDDPEAEGASHGLTRVVSRDGLSPRTMVGDLLDTLVERPGLAAIAIVGGDAMSGNHARDLLASETIAERTLRWDDTFIEPLRLHKSTAEIALMRRAAGIAEEALEAGFAAVVPGAREADAIAAMAEAISRNQAVLANAFVVTYDASGAAEDNRLPLHSDRVFQAGDLFTVDLSGFYAGYLFDIARSTVVGQAPLPVQQRAYDAAKGAVDAIVAGMQPGAVLGDAARAGSAVLRAAGVDPESGEFPARGHGLGLGFEGPWVQDGTELVLEPGMVISIEQFVNLEGAGATFERNILVTEDGPEDLVAVRDFWPGDNGKEAE